MDMRHTLATLLMLASLASATPCIETFTANDTSPLLGSPIAVHFKSNGYNCDGANPHAYIGDITVYDGATQVYYDSSHTGEIVTDFYFNLNFTIEGVHTLSVHRTCDNAIYCPTGDWNPTNISLYAAACLFSGASLFCPTACCTEGDNVGVGFTIMGNCSLGTVLQIDANNSNCSVQYSGGDVSGVTLPEMLAGFDSSSHTISQAWSVPWVPSNCRSNQVFTLYGSLWNGVPGVATKISQSPSLAGTGNITFCATGYSNGTGTTTTTIPGSTTTTLPLNENSTVREYMAHSYNQIKIMYPVMVLIGILFVLGIFVKVVNLL
jgi:hypothetical protein